MYFLIIITSNTPAWGSSRLSAARLTSLLKILDLTFRLQGIAQLISHSHLVSVFLYLAPWPAAPLNINYLVASSDTSSPTCSSKLTTSYIIHSSLVSAAPIPQRARYVIVLMLVC